MQCVLHTVTNLCSLLGLKLNRFKMRAIAVHSAMAPTRLLLQDHPVEWVTNYTYLGIVFDHKLTFAP